MRKYIFLFVLIISFCSSTGQTYLTQRGLNRIVDKAFGSLVTGQTTGTQIANFASFDPIDGSFSFKGVIPIGRPDSGRLSYLSLRFGGDLISNSYSVLFTNSVLNTNSYVQAEWNIRLFGKRRQPIRYLRSDRIDLSLKRNLLENDKTEKFARINVAQTLYSERIQTSTDKRLVLRNDSLRKLADFAAVTRIVNSIRSATPVLNDSLRKYNDSLIKLRAAITGIENQIIATTREIDSLNYISNNSSAYRDLLRKRVEQDHKEKLLRLEDSARLTGITFNWFTLLASVGQKKYYTFDPTKPYSQQIEKEELGTHRYGVSWNYFSQTSFPQRLIYFNIGIARVKENNAAYLGTQEIVQVRTLKNSAGDTVRTITKKYNGYTDPIGKIERWSVFANAYYLLGTTPNGFHLFPEVSMIDEGEDLFNVGIGYVVSFVNEKKDKPIINVEGYINFVDVGNKMESKEDFWNRNEIGLRFTLPFSFLLK